MYECDTGICISTKGKQIRNKCYDIIIEDNRTYKNLSQGILVAGRDIEIRNNIIENELSYGIHVFTKCEVPSENIHIIGNKLINFNNKRGEGQIKFGTERTINLKPDNEAAGVMISGGKDCIIEGNEFIDNRPESLSIWNIQISRVNIGTRDKPVWADISEHNVIKDDNVLCNPPSPKVSYSR